MRAADQYHRFVRWSNDDQLYIGCCPDIYFGGVCHREKEEQVYAELCGIIRDEVTHRQQRGEALPPAAVRVSRDVDLIAA